MLAYCRRKNAWANSAVYWEYPSTFFCNVTRFVDVNYSVRERERMLIKQNTVSFVVADLQSARYQFQSSSLFEKKLHSENIRK